MEGSQHSIGVMENPSTLIYPHLPSANQRWRAGKSPNWMEVFTGPWLPARHKWRSSPEGLMWISAASKGWWHRGLPRLPRHHSPFFDAPHIFQISCLQKAVQRQQCSRLFFWEGAPSICSDAGEFYILFGSFWSQWSQRTTVIGYSYHRMIDDDWLWQIMIDNDRLR